MLFILLRSITNFMLRKSELSVGMFRFDGLISLVTTGMTPLIDSRLLCKFSFAFNEESFYKGHEYNDNMQMRFI